MLDKFGVLEINPTKTGGLEWFCNWSNNKVRSLNEGEYDPYDARFAYSCGQPNVTLKIDGEGQAIVTDLTDSARLFAYGPWLNTEMTVYVKGRTSLCDVQLRSRSNHQIECGFGNYLVKFHRINKKISIEVEPLHPIYQRHLDEHDFAGYSLDRWFGFKQITRTLPNDDNKVKVEGWFNNSENSQKKWKKLTEFTFDGQNTNITLVKYEPYRQACRDRRDKTANDINKGCLWLNPGQCCWIRINDTQYTRIKRFSVREIAI